MPSTSSHQTTQNAQKFLFFQIIVHAKKMISSAVTVFACLRKRVAMDTLIVAIKKTKKGAKAHLATFLNSDVPTAKNASPNFRNATIAKNALTDLMRAIAVSWKSSYQIQIYNVSIMYYWQIWARTLALQNNEQASLHVTCPFFQILLCHSIWN